MAAASAKRHMHPDAEYVQAKENCCQLFAHLFPESDVELEAEGGLRAVRAAFLSGTRRASPGVDSQH